MKKSDKPLIVDQLAGAIKAAKSVTVIDYQKMPTKQAFELRQKIKEAGGQVSVAKNTLLKRAFKKALDTLPDTLDILLTGPTALVLAKTDEIAPLQILGKSFKDISLPKLKFGIFAGELVTSEKLLTLSSLPSKNVLIGQLLGALNGPTYGLLGTLNANMQKLVFVLNQRQEILSTKS